MYVIGNFEFACSPIHTFDQDNNNNSESMCDCSKKCTEIPNCSTWSYDQNGECTIHSGLKETKLAKQTTTGFEAGSYPPLSNSSKIELCLTSGESAAVAAESTSKVTDAVEGMKYCQWICSQTVNCTHWSYTPDCKESTCSEDSIDSMERCNLYDCLSETIKDRSKGYVIGSVHCSESDATTTTTTTTTTTMTKPTTTTTTMTKPTTTTSTMTKPTTSTTITKPTTTTPVAEGVEPVIENWSCTYSGVFYGNKNIISVYIIMDHYDCQRMCDHSEKCKYWSFTSIDRICKNYIMWIFE